MDSQNEIQRCHEGHAWQDFDKFQGAMLVGLSLLLLPAWRTFLGESIGMGNLLAGAFLPAALGFLLALRRGVVDLSVWAVMGAGGLVAAWVINTFASVGPVPAWALLPAIAAAMLTGAIIGSLNALVVRWLPRFGGVATAVVGLAVLGAAWLIVPTQGISIPDTALDSWVSGLNDFLLGPLGDDENPLPGPLLMLRMLVVFLAWTCVLVVLMRIDSVERKRPLPRLRRWARPASLCASGALAALSGVCWLIDQGHTPLPTRLIDELSIPVAAILAGAVLLRGVGRTKLAVICLPPAMLLASVWELMVWPITFHGYSVSLAVLGGLTLLAQRSFVVGHRYAHRSRVLAFVAMIVSAAAITILGLWVWFGLAVHRLMLNFALIAGTAGVILLGITLLFARRHPEDKIPVNGNDEIRMTNQ